MHQRLNPGVSRTEAQALLEVLRRALDPGLRQHGPDIHPLQTAGGDIRRRAAQRIVAEAIERPGHRHRPPGDHIAHR
jgi:hypothetical protein